MQLESIQVGLELKDLMNGKSIIVYIESPSTCPIELYDQVSPYAKLLGLDHWEVNNLGYYTTSEL